MKDRFEAYDDICNVIESETLHEAMLQNDNKKVKEIIEEMRKDLKVIEDEL